MAIGGPSKTRAKSTKQGGSLLHFLQILKYARPFNRYLIPGMLCIVLVAFTYSINIVALLPVIQVITSRQGVPSWTYQSIAEKRSGLLLSLDTAESAVFVVDLDKKAKDAGRFSDPPKRRDLLIKVNGKSLEPTQLFGALASAGDGALAELDFRRAGTGTPYTSRVQLKDKSVLQELMLRGASYLPQGTSKEDLLRTLIIAVSVVMVITLVGAICRFFGEYLIAMVAARTVVSMRKQMYQTVLRLPVSYFATQGVSDMVSRFVQDSQDVYRGLNFVFAKSLREPLKALFVFIAALFIDWRITMLMVVGAPLAALLIRRMGKLIRKAHKRLLENYGRMVATLEGALRGIRVVKGYTMETYERLRLHMVDRQMLRQQLKIEFVDAISSPVFEIVGQAVAALAIIYFAQQMFEGRLELTKFVALAICMAGIFDPVRKMSSFYNRIQTANAAMDRVVEVMNLAGESPRQRALPPLPRISKSIEFRDVGFTYLGADTPALDGVNLTIQCGERVAFVGPNGSGKTTLLSLLMRFFQPQQGSVLIDGNDISGFSLESLRRQMSLITQDTVIFADTIANNIAYGDDQLLRRRMLVQRHPNRDYRLNGQENRILSAAQAAYADEFIREKPEGYDTYVGEHGTMLSGGQKQRIAIARAILRNAPIFIFDEATSQIDSESEHKIHDAVEHFLQGRTALIIAHRFSTILQADRIVVMDRGRIVDSGRHEELISRCKLYQGLYGTQIIDDKQAVD